jgi:hypothetical protein
MMAIFSYQPLEIARTNQVYSYPKWANILGWVVAASSGVCIPVVAVYNMCMAKGSFTEVSLSIFPKHWLLNNLIRNYKQNHLFRFMANILYIFFLLNSD